MAAMTLTAWLAANPDNNKYAGIVAGKPMMYHSGTAGAPSLDTDDWYVFDYITEFPDLSQTPTEVDISTTGSTSRKTIPGVPDAVASTAATVNMGQNTDQCVDDILEVVEANQTAITEGKTFYLADFMGMTMKSFIYAASITWNSGPLGAFGDAITTTVGITPNMGAYSQWQKFTAGAGG
jgi:hypothetical protein